MRYKLKKPIYFFIAVVIIISISMFIISRPASGQKRHVFIGDIDFAPYSFEADGVFQGYLIDIMRALSILMDGDIKVQLMPWDKCLKEIKNGKVDGLIGSPVNRKWENFMSYSTPVCEIEYAIFVEVDNRHIDSIKSLEGTLVGIRKDCHILDMLKKNKRIDFIETADLSEAFDKLKTREITAVIAEKNAGLYYLRKNKLDNIKIAAPLPELIFPYSITVKDGDHELLSEIDRSILSLEINDAFSKLNRRWFGTVIKPFPWHKVFFMTAKITGLLLLLLIPLWVLSLRATIKLKTDQIQRMNLRMIEREKLAVLGKMAGQIAHELRTPLGIIKNSIYLLHQEDPADKQLFDKRLHLIEEKIRLSSDILESILGYSRVKAEAPSEISVKTCIDEVLKDMEIPEGIDVSISMDTPSPLAIYMDFHQLYSVLRNLILNAVQAMRDNGTLSVSAFLSNNGHDVNIRICDTGQGIVESARNKIFNLFYSTKTTGTGLGLPISKSIVEANQGELRLENTSEEGTCFLLTLPSANSPKST